MSHHRWLKVLLVLLIAVALPALVAAQGAGPTPAYPEWEPNDDFGHANEVFPTVEATISPARDVDFFRVYGWPTLTLQLNITLAPGSRLKPVVTLYKPDQTQVARVVCGSASPCLSYLTVEEGYYYVRVTDNRSRGGSAYGYSLTPTYGDPNEPNDTMETATPIVPGIRILGVAGDPDYFAFDAAAGEEFKFTGFGTRVTVFGPNGGAIAELNGDEEPLFQVEATGVHYLLISANPGWTYFITLNHINRPWLFSFDSAGTLGNVSFEPGDLLYYSPMDDSWQMAFDASDMGLSGNLVAADKKDWFLLFTVATPQNVPGIGAVRPQDILCFGGSTIDGETTGTLDLCVKGSKVGLTTSAERIDALGGNVYDMIVASTVGTARLPRQTTGQLAIQKDDLAELYFDSSGSGAGRWWRNFDGAVLGRHGANLIGFDDLGATGDGLPVGLYLLFDRPVTLDGETYGVNDIIRCGLMTWDYQCTTIEEMIDGAIFGNYRLDALSALPYQIR